MLKYIRLQNSKDKEISEILDDAYKSTEGILKALEASGKMTVSAQVQKAQIVTARKELSLVIKAIYDQLRKRIPEAQKDAAQVAVDAILEDEKELWEFKISDRKIRNEIRETEIARARRNIQATVTRNQFTTRTLSQRIYSSEALQKGIVNRKVSVMMAKGSGPQDIAKAVRPFFKESVPGGVTFAAKRLARTEVNNAFHAQSIQDMKDRPWITQAQWNLSKSHPIDQILCLCDKYAIKRFFTSLIFSCLSA